MDGIINIYKEKGFTSHDVVAKLRGIVGQKRIGHTGTLDPDATGVLPVCLGKATKLCDYLTDKDKEYKAVMRLGITTDTLDMTGTVLSESSYMGDKENIIRTIETFVGEIEQIPPMYSAIKVNGKKLYELARKGQEIERKARKVTIHEIEVIDINLDNQTVTIRAYVSKGTYIRTLCDDIGKALGCGAAMQELTRTKSGVFDIYNAIKLGEYDEKHVIAIEDVFAMPCIKLLPEYDVRLRNGNDLEFGMVNSYEKEFGKHAFLKTGEDDVCVYYSDGTFAAVYTKTGKGYHVEKMFV